jgi:hypothetical protein
VSKKESKGVDPVGMTYLGAGVWKPMSAVPQTKQVEVNGAPVTEASHEYVVKKSK